MSSSRGGPSEGKDGHYTSPSEGEDGHGHYTSPSAGKDLVWGRTLFYFSGLAHTGV